MTIHRLSWHPAVPLRTVAAILVLLPAAVSPASAAERHGPRTGVPTTYDAIGALDRNRTGSIDAMRSFTSPSPRSSTLGNADFPERDPSAQHFGNTAGGGLN